MIDLARHGLLFVVYLLLQVFVFRHLDVMNYAAPHPLILFLLFLPTQWPRWGELLAAFSLGLLADLFLKHPGAMAFGCVLVVWLRRYWLTAIQPGMGGEELEELKLGEQSNGWLLSYIFPLVAVFEAAYFVLIDAEVSLEVAAKFAASSVYTGALCFLFALLFYKKKGERR